MNQVIGAGATVPGNLQWHGEMHRQLGAQTLHFWFLRFSGAYRKEEIFSALEDCMESAGASAYAGYELTGEFDVMLRLWLGPSAVSEFDRTVKERLSPVSARYHSVVESLRHWVWEDPASPGSGILPCSIEELDATTLLADVELLNRLSDAAREQETIGAASAREAAVLDAFIAAGAITILHAQNGIRLVLRLRPRQDAGDAELQQISAGIAAELDALRDRPGRSAAERSSGLRVRECSLYRCADATLIALCRIDYRAWHLLREALLAPLLRLTGLEQTTTFPVLSAKFEVYREVLQITGEVSEVIPDQRPEPEPEEPPEEALDPATLPAPPAQVIAVKRLLEREESRDFEVKGSAFAPLDPWLDRALDDPEDACLLEAAGFFRDTIAKSITAMLNTAGGILLVGALESGRYARDNRDRLRLRLEAFPRVGRFHAVGLQDPIFRKDGWDGFERKFHDLLHGSIDGNFDHRVTLAPGWHDGRHLAVVEVKGPGGALGPRSFFLLGDGGRTFYIRRGGRSEPLDQREFGEYLEDHGEEPDAQG